MIERNLRNVTIRKYGSAFLEAFGMLPITYFGCIGDNFTDNYANLQVAVDESIKRGLRYLFVPNGIYYYSGNLLNLDKITFIGDALHATIYDGATELKIYQIGTQLPYVKGATTLDGEVKEVGYIDIPVSVKNASEAILVIENFVISVFDDLNLLNGQLFSGSDVILTNSADNGAYLTKVELLKNDIRLHYEVTGTGGLLSKKVEWRVR